MLTELRIRNFAIIESLSLPLARGFKVLSGETGACAHPGTAGASDTYTFSLPRPSPPQDGSAPLDFTLEADDTAQHETRLPQSVFFDYQGPSISVTLDSTPYARTAVPIPVTALIADPAGVPDGGVFHNGTLAPASRELVAVKLAQELAARGQPVAWLSVDSSKAAGRVTERPTREAIPINAQEQLVVELYSK